MTTGDGGMITTASPEWDQQFRLWRQHAMTVPDTARHASRAVVFEQYSEVGYNYRMTDLQAAIGREQLKRLPDMIERRREIAARYNTLLAGIAGVTTPHEPAWARSNYQSYCVRLPHSCDQRRVMQSMLDAGVATRRGVMCAHREPAYRNVPWRCEGPAGVCDRTDEACGPLVNGEQATAHSLMLPIYVEMTEEDQTRVAAALLTALAQQGQRHGA
jgi:dTDP-4-amino-4,6-dideoxygalactose transaminase